MSDDPRRQDVLRPGSTGKSVLDLQEHLRAASYPVPPASDSVYDEATQIAVRAFQTDRNLRVDGICGPQTWSALEESGFRLGDRLVFLRSPMLRGDDVADLQRRLGALGFDTGRVDGIYGPDTERALTEFQRNTGLVADGIFGKATAEELERLGARGGGPDLIAAVKERESLRHASPTLSRIRISIAHEEDKNAVADAVARRLKDRGATVFRIAGRDGSAQAEHANTSSVEVHLSVLLSDEVDGFVPYFYSGFKYESVGGRRLAEMVHACMEECLGLAGSPPEGMSLPVLRETRMPAVVCEMGPPVLILERCDAVADALCEAIRKWVAEKL